MARILVINPNSNETVTEGLRQALAPLAFVGGPAFECVTLHEGPFGVESQADAEVVVLPLARMVEARQGDCDAFVIACYSDPGIHLCREVSAKPVFGIAECGVLTALARGERFGVLAIAKGSIRRHVRQLRQLGLEHRLAAERALDLTVAETASGERTFERMVDAARLLRDEDGADVVIMGCAGMARHRAPLEQAIGLPVIDPTQAAGTMALGAVAFARDGPG